MGDPLSYKLRDVVSTVQIGGELHDFEITIDNTTDARVIEAQIMKAAFTKFGDGPDIRLVGYTVSSTFEAYGADPTLPADRQITEVMRSAMRNANSTFWKTRDGAK